MVWRRSRNAQLLDPFDDSLVRRRRGGLRRGAGERRGRRANATASRRRGGAKEPRTGASRRSRGPSRAAYSRRWRDRSQFGLCAKARFGCPSACASECLGRRRQRLLQLSGDRERRDLGHRLQGLVARSFSSASEGHRCDEGSAAARRVFLRKSSRRVPLMGGPVIAKTFLPGLALTLSLLVTSALAQQSVAPTPPPAARALQRRSPPRRRRPRPRRRSPAPRASSSPRSTPRSRSRAPRRRRRSSGRARRPRASMSTRPARSTR